MKSALIDLPVALIFFVRPNTFQKVFDKVKKARPSKLFLIQDGPRADHPGDIENVMACRKIAEDIDWECEVYRNYSEVNLGCGKRPATGIDWLFSHVNYAVILEDDCIPNDSFFPYMKELLEKYKNDERIGIISGFNHFKEWDCGEYSYCFTKTGATLGWGTWRRVWEKYDYMVSSIKSPYIQQLLTNEIEYSRAAKARISSWKKANLDVSGQKKISYWDIQFGFVKYTQSLLCIVPNHNLIYNIGAGEGATHTSKIKETTWKLGQVMFMPTKDIEFPLCHPNVIICDKKYDLLYFKKMAYPYPWIRQFRRFIRVLRSKLM